jgi:hypothetical protein
MSDSIVNISGHQYRYRYNPDTGKTEYKGPVGDAPALTEEEFFALIFADEIESKGEFRLEMDVDRTGGRIVSVTDKAGLPEYSFVMPVHVWEFLKTNVEKPGISSSFTSHYTMIEPGMERFEELWQVRWTREQGKLFILWQSSNQSRRPQVVKTEWNLVKEAFTER